jgi:hypothetical protein
MATVKVELIHERIKARARLEELNPAKEEAVRTRAERSTAYVPRCAGQSASTENSPVLDGDTGNVSDTLTRPRRHGRVRPEARAPLNPPRGRRHRARRGLAP